jgi:SAM-dependent methyltransferase
MNDERYLHGAYLGNNPTWHAEDSAFKAGELQALLRRSSLRPARVLDVGCGAGEVLRHLQTQLDKSAQLVGYDISPQAIERAKSLGGERIQFHCGDATTEAATDFDLVLVFDVFEHVEDYFGFLRRVGRLGTHTVFHIPLELTASAALRGAPLMHARKTVGHLHHFSRDTALATLSDCGYRIIEATYTPGAFATAHHLRTRLANVPRRGLFRIAPDLTVRLLGGFSLMVLAERSA